MSTCKANSCYNSTNYSWNDYCSYHESCLSKLRQYKNISDIQEIETFTTWFNGNCGWVINYDYSSSSSYPYHVWVIVYEPNHRSMSENLTAMKCSSRDSLSEARSKAIEIRNELKYNDNPILSIHPKVYDNCSFSSIVTSPYVRKINNISSWTSEPDRYLKPLDIAWVRCEKGGKDFWHVGVYLGNDRVCHFTKGKNNTTIESWSCFLSGSKGSLQGYHPVIPFKDYRNIIRQAVWAKDNNFREGSYNLPNRNCEHFANMLVYGINYSQQIYERGYEIRNGLYGQVAVGTAVAGGSVVASLLLAPFTFGASLAVGAASLGAVSVVGGYGVVAVGNAVEGNTVFNNDKGSICLKDEIRETDNKLGEKSDSETERYERQYLQEIPPKESCRIM